MSSKLQTANEETPLLSAPTIVDQASSSASSDNAKLLSAKKKKASPWHVIVALFCLTFSFGALYAPMIQFYTVIFCYKYYQQQSGDSGADIPLDNCAIPEVQAIVSEAQAIIMFLTYASTLLVASYYGALSDRKGRRLIMMISTLGSLIQIALFIITIKYIHIFGISLLFIAPIIKGLMAGDTVAIAAVQAYISDCTTRAERTIAFGNMMATVFLGTSIGPTVASFLLNKTKSINSIFYMVFIIHFVIGLYFWLVMPESNDISQYNSESKQQGKQSFLQRINIFSALQILHRRSTSEHASQYALPLMAGVQFLLYIVMMPPSLLYAMLQFKWTAYEGGLFFSLCSFTRVVIMLTVLPLLSKIFHRNKATTTSTPSSSPPTSPATSAIKVEEEEPASPSSSTSSAIVDTRSKQDIRHAIIFDSWMIRTGLTIETVCFVAFGLVTTSVGFSITGATQSFALLAAPSLRSLLTSLVDPTEIGELLGAMAVLEACGSKYIHSMTYYTVDI
ncbi:major facilitator superfamily domain-containing protein [Mucor lusitanicus]|uniref:Major facilitator superfamily domain-containing protein n=1 Tax=Mucor circinelloides f. lusitanicus TaxID=29924 RepID=A0A8H4EWR9_MUCCL|nr:major facilitator superfamily domain-containing protein [Mucor lusitanicus]